MDNCIFCKIVKDELPSYKIFENDKYLAFLTIRPHTPGHTMVVPKRHENYFFDLDDQELSEITQFSKEVAQKLKSAFKPRSGKVSLLVMGMGVPHVHIHLIPLNSEADIEPSNSYDASKEELEESQKKIKEAN